MSIDPKFDAVVLQALIDGLPILDIPRLNVQNLEESNEFIRAYGYNQDDEKDATKLWNYYRRAVTFIQSHLLEEGEQIPEALSDPNQLKDLAYLPIYASTNDTREVSFQKWPCGILKVIHVLVHLENDLFTAFSSDIQDQILASYKEHIYQDAPSGHLLLGSPNDPEAIPLKRFDTKPFKTSTSSVTKLLAKPDEIAFAILDKMGVRFVTRNLFDAFAVMRYLTRKNIISYPHIIPDQSTNNLYPLPLFFEVMESITQNKEISDKELEDLMRERYLDHGDPSQLRRKRNDFTSADYRFIKFIVRKLIHINPAHEASKSLSFFYPYEVQIMDYETYLKNLSGPSSHDEYKKRQIRKARFRIFGWNSLLEEAPI
ncbi:MAG: TIGR04552 family protein [Bdellovibrionales bacterium]|nr:TIGR04552 family protein [Bdellovibrionales bacterium]